MPFTLSERTWDELCRKFALLTMSSTKRPSQPTGYWNAIFKHYKWTKLLKSRYLTPALLFPEKERSDVYLILLREKDKPHNELPRNLQRDPPEKHIEQTRILLFKAIRKSLRSYTPGISPWQMQFANFTLDMSCILETEAPHLLDCPPLFEDQSGKQVEIALYAGGLKLFKPKYDLPFGLSYAPGKRADCSVEGFEDFSFSNYDNPNEWYLKSLDLA